MDEKMAAYLVELKDALMASTTAAMKAAKSDALRVVWKDK